ncbi:barwin-like endoglucanase [Diaporthe sp. PMI_573]|jgi:expansin (peptidoglycan-binding protein)|nr:barwin-like endoglucanase [Diaporthaceae sp. PMI_573]
MMSINTITKLAALMAATLGSAATIDTRSPAVDASAASYSGDMTYYYPGLGACGETNTNTDAVAAVSSAVYNSGGGCDRVATIHYNGRSTTARVVDLCPSCATGSIDVSPAVFQALSPLSAGRIQVTWELN